MNVGTLSAGAAKSVASLRLAEPEDPVGVDREIGRGEHLGIGIEAGRGRRAATARAACAPRAGRCRPADRQSMPKSKTGPSGIGQDTVDRRSVGGDAGVWSYGNE